VSGVDPMISLRSAARRALRRGARLLRPETLDLPLSTWRLDRNAAGGLVLRDHLLAPLLDTFGSPLHVVDGVALEDNATRFMQSRDGGRACEVYYSYKTNPVPGVLSRLHALGLGAEVTSPYELWLARKLGVAPASIVYNSPASALGSMSDAIAMGVGLVNLNAAADIAPVAALARSLGKRLRVGLRVAVPGFVAGQFGERIDDGSALRAYAEAMEHPSLEVVGVHAHTNGELSTQAQLDGFLDSVLRFTDTLHEELKFPLEILDLGGNLTCPTVSRRQWLVTRLELALARKASIRSPATALSIDRYVTRVSDTVSRHFVTRQRPAPRIFLEPGRALTANTQMLLCRVAQVRQADDSGIVSAILDAGINVAEALRTEHHQLFRLSETPGMPRRTHRLSGPSCAVGDLLYPVCDLPQLAVGDGLAIMDSGAYFVPYSTCFSFPRPAVVMLDGPEVRLLRRGETFDDLVSLDGQLTAGRPTAGSRPDGSRLDPADQARDPRFRA
jgi:diaminopimelate decarboxylase